MDVSVIIPVYNVEPYLQECLDSVLSQSGCSFEVICIDDGSTDASPKILQEAAQKDPRIRIITQENKGLSAARNRGLEVAAGRYILFVDSDDALTGNSLSTLVGFADRERLDHLIFGLETIVDNQNGIVDVQLLKNEMNYHRVKDSTLFYTISNGGSLFQRLVAADSFYVSTPLHLLKHEVVKDLRFEDGILHEDNLFTPLALLRAIRATIIPDKYYRRRMRGGSIMTDSGQNIRHAAGYFTVAIKLKAMERMFHEQGIAQAMQGYLGLLLELGNLYLLRVVSPNATEQLLKELKKTCRPDEISLIQWFVLPLLNLLCIANTRVQKYRDKRLSSRLKRLFKRKGHAHVK